MIINLLGKLWFHIKGGSTWNHVLFFWNHVLDIFWNHKIQKINKWNHKNILIFWNHNLLIIQFI